MRNVSVYVRVKGNGKVHRVVLSGGDVLSWCHADDGEPHEIISEHDFLRLAVMGQDDLCERCFAAIEEGSGDI